MIGDIAMAFGGAWFVVLVAVGVVALVRRIVCAVADARTRPVCRLTPYRCPTCGAPLRSLLDACSRAGCLHLDLDIDTAHRRADV